MPQTDEEDATEVALTVEAGITEDTNENDEDGGTADEELTEHVPNPAWQPLAVDPLRKGSTLRKYEKVLVYKTHHHPYIEQQFPKVEPEQVSPVLPPHVASVETFKAEALGAAEEETAAGVELVAALVLEADDDTATVDDTTADETTAWEVLVEGDAGAAAEEAGLHVPKPA
ncbi:hypothetical protein LTR04_007398 [Oleoguttula sp. CCFEE 6159]|nr:hypothetical protein LTR04_007398 [Oleoguttula sp. CCFEE 6159]